VCACGFGMGRSDRAWGAWVIVLGVHVAGCQSGVIREPVAFGIQQGMLGMSDLQLVD
jgi:hypothetical protein